MVECLFSASPSYRGSQEEEEEEEEEEDEEEEEEEEEEEKIERRSSTCSQQPCLRHAATGRRVEHRAVGTDA